MTVYPEKSGSVNAAPRTTSVPRRLNGENVSPLVPHFTQIPDIILDRWMAELTGAEFKIVMYVARRTYGFRRTTDDISIKQMASGIVRENGERLDNGTGIGESSVPRSVASLVEKGILNCEKHTDSRGGSLPSTYSLNLDCVFGINEDEVVTPPLSQNETPPVFQNNGTPLSKRDPPLSHFGIPPLSQNETHNIQQLDKQLDIQKDKQQQSDPFDVSASSNAAVFPSIDEEAIHVVIRLGIGEADARSIVSEVGAIIAMEQATWWPQRKAAKNAEEIGAMFRTACRGKWAAPKTTKTVTVKKRTAVAKAKPSAINIPLTTTPSSDNPLWNTALEKLGEVISIPTMHTHLRHFVPVSMSDTEWVLAAPSSQSRSWIEGRYKDKIEMVAQGLTHYPTLIRFTVAEGSNA